MLSGTRYPAAGICLVKNLLTYTPAVRPENDQAEEWTSAVLRSHHRRDGAQTECLALLEQRRQSCSEACSKPPQARTLHTKLPRCFPLCMSWACRGDSWLERELLALANHLFTQNSPFLWLDGVVWLFPGLETEWKIIRGFWKRSYKWKTEGVKQYLIL